MKTDKSQHPLGQVPADKALVYVIEQEKTAAELFKIGAVTIRIGIDGQWVGANHGNTYFYFPVGPGNPAVWMEPLDPAEAKLLMASASLSNFRPKK